MTSKFKVVTFLLLGTVLFSCLGLYLHNHVTVLPDEIVIALEEVLPEQYPDNPNETSALYPHYLGQQLRIRKRSLTHYDFILESKTDLTPTLTLNNINISLFVPHIPNWLINKDHKLEKIALVEREWNRQQVTFEPHSQYLSILKDGQRKQIDGVTLANNCLNAQYWEISIQTYEHGSTKELYHGWFKFPLSYYKAIFKHINQNKPWWLYRWYLAHWINLEGTPVHLNTLRRTIKKVPISLELNFNAKIFKRNEQEKKAALITGPQINTWLDLYKEGNAFHFSKFILPGRYHKKSSQKALLSRIKPTTEAYISTIKLRDNTDREYHEVTIILEDQQTQKKNHFIISGINLNKLPTLYPTLYYHGLYMPIGIQVPPFNQTYENLLARPPQHSPFFSFLLNEKSEWLNHHEIGLDGSVLFRDIKDKNKIHLFLLSYERQVLLAHLTFSLEEVKQKLSHP